MLIRLSIIAPCVRLLFAETASQSARTRVTSLLFTPLKSLRKLKTKLTYKYKSCRMTYSLAYNNPYTLSIRSQHDS